MSRRSPVGLGAWPIARGTLLCAMLAAALATSGCDDSSAPGSAGGGGGGGGQGLSGLSETPTSLAGRSAATGRDAARKITAGQDAASNLADEISGDGSGFTVNNLKFPIPAEWEKSEAGSKMQLAAYRVAADEGKGETQVVFFANIGGNVESNIARWRTQVTKDDGQPAAAKVERIEVKGLDVHMVSMNGTYAGMASPSQPKMANYGFRAAIVVSKSGPIYVRMTGPQSSVEEAESAFFGMVKGFGESK